MSDEPGIIPSPQPRLGDDTGHDQLTMVGSVLQDGHPIDEEISKVLVDLMLILAHYPDAAPPPIALPDSPDSLPRIVWRALFK